MNSTHPISSSSPHRRKALLLIVIGLMLLFGVRSAIGAALQSSITMTVTSTADDSDANLADGICDNGQGICTLRAALEEANVRSGKSRIVFNISGDTPHTIRPLSPLPIMTQPVIIDGAAVAADAGKPVIELNGRDAGDAAVGLHLAAGDSTIRGLVITHFDGSGILLQGPGGNIVSGNFIGTDSMGLTGAGNDIGILIDNSSHNTIGGLGSTDTNVIAGNATGIYLYGVGAHSNRIWGNHIGSEDVALSNWHGIRINNAPGNIIGGGRPAAANLLAGNEQSVVLLGSETRDNQITGNIVHIEPSEQGIINLDMMPSSQGVQNQENHAPLPFNEIQEELKIAPEPAPDDVNIPDQPNDTWEEMPEKESFVTPPPVASNISRDSFSKMPPAQTPPAHLVETIPALQTLAVTFVVNSTGDAGDAKLSDGVCATSSGVCTLRAAIQQANALSGLDGITFNIPGAGPHIIQPASRLPTITSPLIIDGTTQPGFDPSTAIPVIEIRGFAAGAGADGFRISAGGSTVRGLAILGFDDAGIELQGAGGNLITGNSIGPGIAGMHTQGNFYGVLITGSSQNTIGGGAAGQGNVISLNWNDGLVIRNNAADNVVQGNRIGTNLDGTAVRGNGRKGIQISGGSGNLIGGAAGDQRNIIAGNGSDGINIGSNSVIHNNTIQGNHIGVNSSGTAVLGNGHNGIALWRVAGHTISGNVISGHGGEGIQAGESTNLSITGNFIGTNAAGTAVLGNSGDGISLWEVSHSTIGGILPEERNVIAGHGDDGISISSNSSIPGNSIQGNHIGVNSSGTAILGNADDGIALWRVAGHTISHNVIAGHGSDGIQAGESTNLLITGNFIGTDAAGSAVLGNSGHGINLWEVSHSTIGGALPEQRNVIAGHGNDGISISSNSHVPGNSIQGNHIGVNSSGTAVLGNTDDGIALWRVAGLTISGNVLSGHGGDGIQAGESTHLSITGNFIGTDAAGSAVLGNGQNGMDLWRVTGHTISQNLVSGNGNHGLQIGESTDLLIVGNHIGTDAAGTGVLGNGNYGIYLYSTRNSAIGGVAAGDANRIAHNANVGIYITGNTSTGNAMRGNAIWNNGALGIDLAPHGVTANDPGDGDNGPNLRQNFPVINSASSDQTATAVAGTFNSRTNAAFTLEFFANTTCDASGYGEGQQYLGSTAVATDGSGNVSFSLTLPIGNLGNTFVTATATDAAGNTSEFSLCFLVEAAHTRSWQLVSTTTAPLVAGEYVAAYDENRQVMVLYGGNAGGWPYETGTWEFDGADWTLRTTAQHPTAVYGAAMAYDQNRQVMVLFGGSDADDAPLNETWEYDGLNWTQILPATSPPPRIYHSMVYAPSIQQMILFGGQEVGAYHHDIWFYDGATWSGGAAPDAPARALHAATFNTQTNQMIIVSGADASGALLPDMWFFSPASSAWATAVPPLPARQAHSLVYDASADYLLLVGGANNEGDVILNDAWQYAETSGWTAVSPPPVAAAYHQLVYDSARQVIILFINGQTWQYE